MADVRCPMCGKSNPADQDVCKFCQARLTPLRLGEQAEDASTEPEADVPEWLRSFRQGGDSFDTAALEGDNEESPDWLSSFRVQPAQDAGPFQGQGEDRLGDSTADNPGADALPSDWLGDFRWDASSNDASASSDSDARQEQRFDWSDRIGGEKRSEAPGAEAELPDWMAGAGLSDWASQPAQENAKPAPTRADTGLPDWLTGSGGESSGWTMQDTPDAPVEEIAAMDDLPDWLSGAGGPAKPAAVADDLPDWLSGAKEPAPAADAPDTGLPDWLSGTGRPDAAADSLPDWLSGVQEPASAANAPDAGLLPDWLSRANEPPKPAAAADDLPDWFSGAKQPAPAADAPGMGLPNWLSGTGKPGEPADAAADDLPDWLSGVEEQETASAASEAGLLDWLSPQPAQPPEQPKPGKAERDTPDWLSQMGSDIPDWLSTSAPGAEAAVSASAQEDTSNWPDDLMGEAKEALQPSSEEMPDWMRLAQPGGTKAKVSFDGEEEPDWLKNFAGEDTSKKDLAALGAAAAAGASLVSNEGGAAEEELGWLAELEAAFPGMTTSPGGLPEPNQAVGELETVSSEALPEWLSEPAQEKPAAVQSSGAARGQDESDILPAQLPSWLEAMRPVVTVNMGSGFDDLERNNVEGAGPLAGLRGVLPAEPDISEIQKPPVYTVKLQIDDIQQAQADLFDQLVKTEGDVQPIPGKPVVTSQRMLRILIAVALMIVLALPMVVPLPLFGAAPVRPEVQITGQLISGLPPGASVLLAIDYEPGFSGELGANAGAVTAHLMRQGASLAVVSTLPTGPLQAALLIESVDQRGGYDFQSPDRYRNLGYIPGGAIGLLSFADAPRQTLPVDINGEAPWASPFLSKINTVADFDMLVVVTENPDIARSWIEQIQPKVGNKPLILITSSQNEPIVRPYYESGQVQGLVGGLAAGTAYEVENGLSGNASLYWPVFNFGLFMGGVLILLSGAMNLVIAQFSKRKAREKAKGEAANG